jgi:signal transduction histidine kinase
MARKGYIRHERSRRAAPLRLIIFVGAIMLPTIVLGYLAIRTAETERLLVWEQLKESYTSLASLVSDYLDNMLYSAEDDFRDSLSLAPSYSKSDLEQLSRMIQNRHGVIGQTFFLNSAGRMIFPEDPQGKWGDASSADQYVIPSERDEEIFESYIVKAERQEFKYNNPRRAIDVYQELSSDVKDPAYKATALNGIARCYTKLGLDQEALSFYNRIIDKYNVNDGEVNIAAMAYLQSASIYEKSGDVNDAIETLMKLYSNLSDNRWKLGADEIWYFTDKARRRLLAYMDSGDVRFAPFAGKFAEVDAEVLRLVKLKRFLKNYRDLASTDIRQTLDRVAENPESARRLLKATSTGPYLISYLQTTARSPSIEGSPSGDEIALAGFEVNLFFLASRGFKDALSRLTTRKDMMLAILNENNEVLRMPAPIPGVDIEYEIPEVLGKPINVVSFSSLPFWRVGVYLKNPQSLENLSKRKANLRILVIVGLVLAIAFGIYLIVREERREAELARLRSDFVANVSHELRTPLSSIQMLSDTLKQGKADSQEKYLDTISSESVRLARLVGNVLDFSKLERSVEEFSFQPIDIGEVATSAVEAYRFYAEQRDAKIHLNIAQDLPEIEADSEAISQLLINLVDNAVKYSEDQKEITVNVFSRRSNIVIQVVDRGVGIDEEDIKKIFDKFYRGKNAADLGTGGTGLGLTLAKAIVVAHGGDIRVRSKKGAGSRFSVILPLSRKALDNGKDTGS